MTRRPPRRYFKTGPVIIRLAVILYIRFPLSLRNVAMLCAPTLDRRKLEFPGAETDRRPV